MEKEPYTDTTILLWGPHKFTSVSRIPAEYLLSLHKGNTHDKRLVEYIEANREKLESMTGRETLQPPLMKPCDKKLFVTEGEAKRELERIKKLKHNNGMRPTRAYQCPRCGGWHHTSLSKKQWESKKSSFR